MDFSFNCWEFELVKQAIEEAGGRTRLRNWYVELKETFRSPLNGFISSKTLKNL